MNIEITEELRQEGLVRDLVRSVNDFRKKSGLTIQDRATLHLIVTDKDLVKAIKAHEKTILDGTLSDTLEWTAGSTPTKKGKIQGIDLEIGLTVN